MSILDVERLLQPVDPEDPCGPDLGYDDDFRQMEQAAEGQPQRQMGDTVIDEVPPDWADVKKLALSLCERTKDLRVAVFLARACVRTDGFAGLADVLELMTGLVGRYWADVHPKLDPDYDNDPTRRVNILGALATREAMLNAIRDEVPLARAAGSRVTLRDTMVASGAMAAPSTGDDEDGAPPVDQASIESVFARADGAALAATLAAVRAAQENLAALNGAIEEQLDPTLAPELEPLEKLLAQIDGLLEGRVADGGEVTGDTGATDGEGGDAPAAGPVALPNRVNSREQVIQLLDLAIGYFERNEPSSPIPPLIRRIQRLIPLDFLAILEDISPDGLDQARNILGVRRDEE